MLSPVPACCIRGGTPRIRRRLTDVAWREAAPSRPGGSWRRNTGVVPVRSAWPAPLTEPSGLALPVAALPPLSLPPPAPTAVMSRPAAVVRTGVGLWAEMTARSVGLAPPRRRTRRPDASVPGCGVCTGDTNAAAVAGLSVQVSGRARFALTDAPPPEPPPVALLALAAPGAGRPAELHTSASDMSNMVGKASRLGRTNSAGSRVAVRARRDSAASPPVGVTLSSPSSLSSSSSCLVFHS